MDGGTLKTLKILSVQASDNSVWLGNKLHVTDRDGRAQLQIRKDTIPVYLAGLGVVTADVTALGTTGATATLDHWVQLSTDAGGSDQLSTIFPVANQSTDFELRTTVNELLVKPQDATARAGITVNPPAGGHPVLLFKGSASGHGLIEFGDQSQSFAEVFHSATTDDLHLNCTGGKVKIAAQALDLEVGCGLQRGGDRDGVRRLQLRWRQLGWERRAPVHEPCYSYHRQAG